MAKDLTTESWLAEIEKLQCRKVNGLTVSEIVAATGRPRVNILRAIRTGIANGSCVFVGRKTAQRIDGVSTPIPAYRFIRKGKV